MLIEVSFAFICSEAFRWNSTTCVLILENTTYFNKKAYADTDGGKETIKKHCSRDLSCAVFDAITPFHMHVKPPLAKACCNATILAAPLLFDPLPKPLIET